MNTNLTAAPTTPVELESNKQELTKLADLIFDQMLEDGGDVLLLLAQIGKFELVTDRLKERAKTNPAIIREVLSYGRAGVNKLGISFSVKEVGVKYGYEHDSTWVDLNNVVATATEARKVRETYLKAVPVGGVVETDEATGETRRVHAASKKATESVVMKID